MKIVFLFILIYVVLVFFTYIVYATNAINMNNWVIIAGFIIFFVTTKDTIANKRATIIKSQALFKSTLHNFNKSIVSSCFLSINDPQYPYKLYCLNPLLSTQPSDKQSQSLLCFKTC